jgi:threonine dehydratase
MTIDATYQDLGPREALELVRSVQAPTPLEPATNLDEIPDVLLKREDLGPNGSFKWRGALCAGEAFLRAGARSMVTASTGNHGAATAWSAARLGIEAHIVVPEGTSEVKCAQIVAHGARLHRHGVNLVAAVRRAESLSAEIDAPYFEDGAVAAQLRGTGTIGAEIADCGADTVIVPLAVGALAGGIARCLAEIGSGMRVVGVQAKGFDRIATLLRGDPDPGEPDTATFADGLADFRLVDPAFAACRTLLDEIVVVDDAEIAMALRELRDAEGIILEGAGAAALAGLKRLDQSEMAKVVLVASGHNIDPGTLATALGEAR